MEDAKLDEVTFYFSQEGNYEDDVSVEILEITCKSSLGIDNDKGGFYVIKTEQWSFETLDELKKIIERIERVINK